MIVHNIEPVQFLILGAGWTSEFLIPLLQKNKVTFAATTTTGRDGTIPFKYDPESDDPAPFQRLPAAQTVLITFPLKGKGPSKHLTSLYKSTHPGPHSSVDSNFIQLGATFLWKDDKAWSDEKSPIDSSNERGIAEDELISVANGAVLDLAGLYGGKRQPRGWVDRVVKSKADLKGKGSIHLVHGNDVARAILALHQNFTPSKRWLLTDMRVYDWWDLIQDWANLALREADSKPAGEVDGAEVLKQRELARWVAELMDEEGVKALPRDADKLGRRLDARAFWKAMGIWPIEGRVR